MEDGIEMEEDNFLGEFVEEAKEYLENIEIKILELERDMNNKETINVIFRNLHTLKGLAGFVAQEEIEFISHKTENILASIRKNEFSVSKKVIDLILATVDFIRTITNDIKIVEDEDFKRSIRNHYEELDNFKALNPKIGEIFKEKIGMSESDIDRIAEKQKESYPDKKFGEVAVIENMVTAKEVIDILRVQEEKEETGEQGHNYGSFVKISTYKLEEIADMLGELMTLQLQIGEELEKDGKYSGKYGRMEKIMKEIQTNFMEMRMVSFKPLFQKLSRIARDTSKDLGIEINIEVEGESEETDRNIAEKLFEPMLHLVKNAMYHGIFGETADEREKSGKSRVGTLKISAYSNRGTAYLTVEDDGRGIDIEKIYRKALNENMIDSTKKYNEQDIIEFIFKPGFSTCDSVNKISGRGVGLDIVKTELYKIGGKVEIESKKGEGTKFSIKVPINMAVINGTVITANNDRYIIPTSYIKEIIKNEESINYSKMGENNIIKIRDTMFSVIDNKVVFGKNTKSDSANIVIVLEHDGKQAALKIDNIIERREVVVKQISEEVAEIPNIIGGTILGDGKVALILDVESFF